MTEKDLAEEIYQNHTVFNSNITTAMIDFKNEWFKENLPKILEMIGQKVIDIQKEDHRKYVSKQSILNQKEEILKQFNIK